MSELASTAALDANVAAAKKKVRRHRQMVMALRLAFGIGMLGSWEILSRTKTIDPFFFGMPSGIWTVIHRWVTVGTPDGPLFEQVWVTLEEALLGFLLGVVGGVIFGLALRR